MLHHSLRLWRFNLERRLDGVREGDALGDGTVAGAAGGKLRRTSAKRLV